MWQTCNKRKLEIYKAIQKTNSKFAHWIKPSKIHRIAFCQFWYSKYIFFKRATTTWSIIQQSHQQVDNSYLTTTTYPVADCNSVVRRSTSSLKSSFASSKLRISAAFDLPPSVFTESSERKLPLPRWIRKWKITEDRWLVISNERNRSDVNHNRFRHR